MTYDCEMPNNEQSSLQPDSDGASGRPNNKPSNVKKEDEDDKPIGLKKKLIPKKLKPDDVKQVSVKKKEERKPIAKKGKKEEDEDEVIVKKKCVTGSSGSEKNGTKKQKKVKVEVKIEQSVKKEKKVYNLPGQKRDPPEERDPSRIFYETLYQQVPTSEMAQVWMMECGLLPENIAKQVFEKKQKKAQTLRSPAKSPASIAKQEHLHQNGHYKERTFLCYQKHQIGYSTEGTTLIC